MKFTYKLDHQENGTYILKIYLRNLTMRECLKYLNEIREFLGFKYTDGQIK